MSYEILLLSSDKLMIIFCIWKFMPKCSRFSLVAFLYYLTKHWYVYCVNMISLSFCQGPRLVEYVNLLRTRAFMIFRHVEIKVLVAFEIWIKQLSFTSVIEFWNFIQKLRHKHLIRELFANGAKPSQKRA